MLEVQKSLIGYGCLKPLIFLLLSWSSTLKPCNGVLNKIDDTYLEVDDDKDDNDSGNEIQQIWSILSVECLLEAIQLVWLGKQEVEQSNDGTFELSSLISSNGNWRE